VSDYKLDNQDIRVPSPSIGKKNLPLASVSRPTPRPTQLWPGCDAADHSPTTSAKVKNE
jgi:hypothetical protein